MDKDQMWDALIDMGVSEQTLQIVTSINGYHTGTMEDILFAHTGERSFDNDAEESSEEEEEV